MMTEAQIKKFQELVKPVMKFLCEEFHPHVTVIIEPTHAEIVEGLASFPTAEFLKD